MAREEKGGKEPAEPGSHPEFSGEVNGAGGGPAAAQSTTVASVDYGENGDGDGDSRVSSSIPPTRRMRAARRSFRARRRSSG
jgi:hypothetical protein